MCRLGLHLTFCSMAVCLWFCSGARPLSNVASMAIERGWWAKHRYEAETIKRESHAQPPLNTNLRWQVKFSSSIIRGHLLLFAAQPILPGTVSRILFALRGLVQSSSLSIPLNLKEHSLGNVPRQGIQDIQHTTSKPLTSSAWSSYYLAPIQHRLLVVSKCDCSSGTAAA